jgi:hypothetical protein
MSWFLAILRVVGAISAAASACLLAGSFALTIVNHGSIGALLWYGLGTLGMIGVFASYVLNWRVTLEVGGPSDQPPSA